MVLKFKYVLFVVMLTVFTVSEARELELDSKYVRLGYISNESIDNSDNLYIHNIGNIENLKYSTADQLNSQGIGKKVLNLLLQRDEYGLHIDTLYMLALSNVSIAEGERAALDASADKRDVLKKLIVRQILKNNYIILSERNANNMIYNVNWRVFHVDIDDRIIDQVFSNWYDNKGYEQISVEVSFVAEGKAKTNEDILNAIINKVNAFAPHSAILKRHPFTVGFGTEQSAKLLDCVEVYRLYENKNGDIKVKKICNTRITEVTPTTSRLFSINGGYASQSKGDIAILRKRRKLNNISIVGQYSFGKDYRYGGRIFYERLLKLSKHGLSQYLLGSVDYNRYCREPDGIWYPYFGAKEFVRPTLSNFGLKFGYSLGFMGLLGKIEIAPYAMAGFTVHFFDHNVLHYDYTGEVGENPATDMGIDVCGGIKANINLWYPFQITFGVDYNFNISSISNKDVSYVYLEHHIINRFNFFAGLRFNF